MLLTKQRNTQKTLTSRFVFFKSCVRECVRVYCAGCELKCKRLNNLNRLTKMREKLSRYTGMQSAWFRWPGLVYTCTCGTDSVKCLIAERLLTHVPGYSQSCGQWTESTGAASSNSSVKNKNNNGSSINKNDYDIDDHNHDDSLPFIRMKPAAYVLTETLISCNDGAYNDFVIKISVF